MSEKPKFCPDCGARLENNQYICQKCGYEVEYDEEGEENYEIQKAEQKLSKEVTNPNWSDLEPLVKTIGEWAWVIVLANGIIYLITGILGLIFTFGIFTYIWDIISATITIFLGIYIIRPRFSEKCAAKDWNYLLNDVLILGDLRIPWILIWSLLLILFGHWWAGIPVLIPTIILLFAGPKPYKWEK
ncbi:MAG: conserved membrane protein of unknown function [Promethearchaeota archaeon]|nr:MAG: conserved membrane protein of unknown function [Candidatus Lokiarchaeota archaeon]